MMEMILQVIQQMLLDPLEMSSKMEREYMSIADRELKVR